MRRRRRPGLVQRADVPCPACGGRTQQNPAERERGYFWCPNCGRYPDGLSRIEGDSDPVEPRSPAGQTSGVGGDREKWRDRSLPGPLEGGPRRESLDPCSAVFIFGDMSRELDRAVDRVLEATTWSVRELAAETGYHRSLFVKIRAGERSATPETAEALAKALRRRGEKLLQFADRLEAEARSERERRRS